MRKFISLILLAGLAVGWVSLHSPTDQVVVIEHESNTKEYLSQTFRVGSHTAKFVLYNKGEVSDAELRCKRDDGSTYITLHSSCESGDVPIPQSSSTGESGEKNDSFEPKRIKSIKVGSLTLHCSDNDSDTKCTVSHPKVTFSFDGRFRWINGDKLAGRFFGHDCVAQGFMDEDYGSVVMDEHPFWHYEGLQSHSNNPLFTLQKFNTPHHDTVAIWIYYYGATGWGGSTLHLFNLTTDEYFSYESGCASLPDFTFAMNGTARYYYKSDFVGFLGCSYNFEQFYLDFPIEVQATDGRKTRNLLIAWFERKFGLLGHLFSDSHTYTQRLSDKELFMINESLKTDHVLNAHLTDSLWSGERVTEEDLCIPSDQGFIESLLSRYFLIVAHEKLKGRSAFQNRLRTLEKENDLEHLRLLRLITIRELSLYEYYS